MAGFNGNDISRRKVLRATGAATGLAFAGTAATGTAAAGEGNGTTNCPRYWSVAERSGDHDGGSGDQDQLQQIMCPEHGHTNTGSGHTAKHDNGGIAGCPTGDGVDLYSEDGCTLENWPDCTNWPTQSKQIIKDTREALTTTYDDVGTLIATGYIPYFDVVRPGATGGVSHWLNPGYIDDGSPEPDPYRQESIVLDNMYWNPLGPMYIATKYGDRVWANKEEGIQEAYEFWGYENQCGMCSPWHEHDGVPGRFAWWYYRQVHEADYAEGEAEKLTLPCYSPPVMHAWIYPTPAGPHSSTSGAPPREYRPDEPALPGYPTPAVPGEDELSYDVLPDSVSQAAMPARLEAELHVIADLFHETLETATLAELEEIMTARLGPVGDGLDSLSGR